MFLGFERFLGFRFSVFLVQRPNTKVRPKVHEKRPIDKSTTWNEDEIDESHKSQLKFEYDVHLLNYTIKIKT